MVVPEAGKGVQGAGPREFSAAGNLWPGRM